jgi:hypothetical protein
LTLCRGASSEGFYVRAALEEMGMNTDNNIPGRALVHVHEALLLASTAVDLLNSWDSEDGGGARDILDMDKDHQAPYTIRAWAPCADHPATHLELEATKAAALHEASIWMQRQPDERHAAAGAWGFTTHTPAPQVPLAVRAHSVSQLREALAYCTSFSYEVCDGCALHHLVWPACRGKYCLGCLLSWFCEHSSHAATGSPRQP